ncbi:hypothetical protein CUMW_149390 [Citrus unshiu]|nr:hypothetical protein CUMW_149390 [Citrus unshiu]
MEAIKKQAIKLREQVAKQQQAVLKHLLHLGIENVDESEIECHQQLQNLYNSTRAAKMILEEQSNESSSQHVTLEMDVNASCVYQNTDSNGADLQMHVNQNDVYFIAKLTP